MLDKEKQDEKVRPRRYSTIIPLALFVLTQIISVVIPMVFYENLLEISPYGCSGLISALLAGLSEGLLGLFVHRRFVPSRLLRFYVWGFLNGIWTVGTIILYNCRLKRVLLF
jgi:hypothetical protein